MTSAADSNNSTMVEPDNREAFFDRLPCKYERDVIAVSVGNTHYNWAMLDGFEDNFSPTLYWRTPVMTEDYLEMEPTSVVLQCFPDGILARLYGVSDDVNAIVRTKESALKMASTRRIPAISIIAITSNEQHLEPIRHMFRDLPHRLIQYHTADFFQPDDLPYDGFGVDRAASLHGSASRHGGPCLVIDAGTATNYCAIDENGRFIGGGITPGIQTRLLALAEYCEGIPRIEHDECMGIFHGARERKRPLQTFDHASTKEQIVGNVLSETAVHLGTIVRKFIETVNNPIDRPKGTGTIRVPMDTLRAHSATAAGANEKPESNGNTEKAGAGVTDTAVTADTSGVSSKRLPVVILTGGDTDTVRKLLQPDQYVLYFDHAIPDMPRPDVDYKLYNFKRVGIYGVSTLLNEISTAERQRLSEIDEFREMMMGQRVAWEFPTPDMDGDSIYRGSIVKVMIGETIDDDLFKVRYDDGDEDEKDSVEIYQALELYTEHGEKLTMRLPGHQAKAQDAKKSMDGLLAQSPRVKGYLKERETAKEPETVPEPEDMAVDHVSAGETGTATAAVVEPVAEEPRVPPKEPSEPVEAEPAASKGATDEPQTQASEPVSAPEQAKESPASRKATGKRALQVDSDAEPRSNKKRRGKRAGRKSKSESYVGKRIAKLFELVDDEGKPYSELYFGTVDRKSGQFWHVLYDDDDEEDLELVELKDCLQLYESKQAEDPNATSS